jgi:hypothetical protein
MIRTSAPIRGDGFLLRVVVSGQCGPPVDPHLDVGVVFPAAIAETRALHPGEAVRALADRVLEATGNQLSDDRGSVVPGLARRARAGPRQSPRRRTRAGQPTHCLTDGHACVGATGTFLRSDRRLLHGPCSRPALRPTGGCGTTGPTSAVPNDLTPPPNL